MKSVLLDVLRANAYNDTRRYKDSSYIHDTAYAALYESVFVAHHITREQFYDSYDYYTSRPDEFRGLIDSLAVMSTKDMSRPGMMGAPHPNGNVNRPGTPPGGPGFNRYPPTGPGGHPPLPPAGRFGPGGRPIGPDGRLLPPGTHVGPDGRPIPPGTHVGPDGRPIPPGARPGQMQGAGHPPLNQPPGGQPTKE
jgi:hypothetical protein